MKEKLFDDVYNSYYNDVYRLAYSYVLNNQDAEDIVQKTFLKLYKNIHKIHKSNNDIKKWLFRVAINECKDLLRFLKTKTFVSLNEEITKNGYNNKNNSLMLALMNIQKNYRIPLFLYYFEGYNINEISKIMKKSESSIKMSLSRGREKLKKEMEEK